MSPADDQTDDLEVRRTVLGEHEELRRQLDQIDALLVEAEAGREQAVLDARGKFQTMLVFALRHLEHEETLLTPILATAEAWGPVRLEQLQQEHAAQRVEISQLVALGPRTSAHEWISRMKQFSASLRVDMAGEEYDFIHPNVVPHRSPSRS